MKSSEDAHVFTREMVRWIVPKDLQEVGLIMIVPKDVPKRLINAVSFLG